jgi:hypothetical protein
MGPLSWEWYSMFKSFFMLTHTLSKNDRFVNTTSSANMHSRAAFTRVQSKGS